MIVSIDTNVLIYAEGGNDPAKHERATALLAALAHDRTILPAQVLGELYNVLVRKSGWPRPAARDAVLAWCGIFEIVPTAPETVLAALDLATYHQLSIWDAVIVAASSRAGCRVLLSEDMHAGFTWGGVTIVDPFADPDNVLLATALAAAR